MHRRLPPRQPALQGVLHPALTQRSACVCAGGWEALRRGLRMNVRSFDHTLHFGLGAILVGGLLMFEYVHNAVWRLKNAG
jgi:hypothetical protein